MNFSISIEYEADYKDTKREILHFPFCIFSAVLNYFPDFFLANPCGSLTGRSTVIGTWSDKGLSNA